ncbi:MAG: GTP 3',8-cyclase MoaA [Anaerolineaceae bacterium]|nr:GTP 3',8-cyclase MoaA [Anaerolineaceae bacterium]
MTDIPVTASPVTDVYQRPLRDLRISVTDRCNFRCTYCMPEEIFGEKYKFLPHPEILTYEEITRLTRIIVRLGAVKLRLTGGEPLMRRDIEQLIQGLAQLDGVHDIAMTTNAFFLPQKAHALREAGLQRITVSLDSLDDATFRKINGNRSSVEQVLTGIKSAQEAGFDPIKINAVVQRGVNEDQIVELARFCRDEGLILRLIEYMDVGTMNGWRMDQVVPAQEMVERIDAAFPLKPVARNYQSETALRFEYADGQGEVGMIASVTQPFCGACSRMRLSPQGGMYTCLFATEGIDLKTPLRDGATDDELEAIIRGTWQKRTDAYSEQRTSATTDRKKVEMYFIGG